MDHQNGYLEHVTADGDRWDLLAYRYYGNAALQTVLMDANASLFIDPLTVPPLILPAGLKLVVPILADEAASDESQLPPWKRTGGGNA